MSDFLKLTKSQAIPLLACLFVCLCNVFFPHSEMRKTIVQINGEGTGTETGSPPNSNTTADKNNAKSRSEFPQTQTSSIMR